MARTTPLALVAAAAVAALFGAALAGPASAHGAEIIEQEYDVRFIVEPQKWAEVNLQLEADAPIEWDIRTLDGTEIYLDLHGHDPFGGVEYHEQAESTTSEAGTFTPEKAGDYSFLVENKQDVNATVQIQISGRFALESEYHITPLDTGTESSPAPAALLLMAITALAVTSLRRRRL